MSVAKTDLATEIVRKIASVRKCSPLGMYLQSFVILGEIYHLDGVIVRDIIHVFPYIFVIFFVGRNVCRRI